MVSIGAASRWREGRFRGVILLAGLKRSILGEEVSGTSKERGAVGFTDLGGLILNQLLTGGRQFSRNPEVRVHFVSITGDCRDSASSRDPFLAFAQRRRDAIQVNRHPIRTPAAKTMPMAWNGCFLTVYFASSITSSAA